MLYCVSKSGPGIATLLTSAQSPQHTSQLRILTPRRINPVTWVQTHRQKQQQRTTAGKQCAAVSLHACIHAHAFDAELLQPWSGTCLKTHARPWLLHVRAHTTAPAPIEDTHAHAYTHLKLWPCEGVSFLVAGVLRGKGAKREQKHTIVKSRPTQLAVCVCIHAASTLPAARELCVAVERLRGCNNTKAHRENGLDFSCCGLLDAYAKVINSAADILRRARGGKRVSGCVASRALRMHACNVLCPALSAHTYLEEEGACCRSLLHRHSAQPLDIHCVKCSRTRALKLITASHKGFNLLPTALQVLHQSVSRCDAVWFVSTEQKQAGEFAKK